MIELYKTNLIDIEHFKQLLIRNKVRFFVADSNVGDQYIRICIYLPVKKLGELELYSSVWHARIVDPENVIYYKILYIGTNGDKDYLRDYENQEKIFDDTYK